jgi:protein TonB
MAPAREKEMFNNLIESSSHARELKRRGSFVLFTTATYLLLFAGAGVASIYAYDASLSEPTNDLELISYVPLQPDKVVSEPAQVRRNNPPAGASQGPRSVRPVLIDRADNPLNPPALVSAVASQIPPAHPNTVIGTSVIEPSGYGPGRDGNSNTGEANVLTVRTPDPPPLPVPAPAPAPKRIVTSSRVLNGLALVLPKPAYPPIAKQAGIQGAVNVQVLVDESGRVISAKAVSGSPLLMHAAQQAALSARFSPTKLGEQAMKVSGVITYNFLLQ